MTATPDVSTDLAAAAAELRGLERAAIERAREWVGAAGEAPSDAAAERLAGLLGDPRGLDFAVGFIDGVIRPEDPHVSARRLRELSREAPRFLTWPLRAGLRLGGQLAPVVPRLVVPAARRVLRSLLRHLVIDARPRRLGPSISRLRRSGGTRLNLNLLGEAVLGHAEAGRRLAGTLALIERDDVDYVSVKVSAVVAPHTPWAFDAAVAEAVAQLRPLYVAAARGEQTFINLDMEEYRDLDLTIAVFTTLLDDPDLRHYSGGIVLQAYLPDALSVMARLQEWAARRVAAGGSPVKVRVVKGANLPMERVDSDLHDWPLATWGSKAQTDANYKAVLAYALTPERTANVRIGVAGHNLFDLALAWELAGERGVRDAMDVEMLLGMAPQQAAAVRATVGEVLLYTPLVRPQDFDAAIAYLIRRLEEGAASENFMSAVFDLDDPAVFDRERDRFQTALALLPTEAPEPHRVQDRRADVEEPATVGFENEPDSDPSVGANRAWAASIRTRMPNSELGDNTVAAAWVDDDADLDALVEATSDAGRAWGARSGSERAEVLRRAAGMLARRRGDLIEVMGSECGKTVEQADPEVSEAIDFAHYYADAAERLETVAGARFEPLPLTVVTPPWNFPVAIPAGGVLAALAAGSAVVLKPAEPARRCGALVAEVLWEAGVPRDALQCVRVDEEERGGRLLAHPRVDQVILTGGYETARLFRSFDHGMRLFAETSGKNAIVVTPSADLDLAAKDVAASAFGHAGQKCSAASLVVLVGSVARSDRFRRQLVDAVSSMRVGPPDAEDSQIGPVIEPPRGKLRRALTTLDYGESWLVEPYQVGDDAALWSPGVKAGVEFGSEFHLTEYFGPVLGVMEAPTLDAALEIVNAVEYGLTSGLHSLDRREIDHWLARAQAGNLYVNRGITGAIVQRQPFGGWKRSAVGTGTKAGGPHYVASLGRWVDDPTPSAVAGEGDPLTAGLLAASADVAPDRRDWLAGALGSDAVAWTERFGAVHDPAGLQYEVNAFRYQAVPVTVRAGIDADVADVVRVVGAGLRAGAPLLLSVAAALPTATASALAERGVTLREEGDEAWAARVADVAREAEAGIGARVRLVGADVAATVAATGGSPDVALHAGEVTSAGEVELLPFLREQAVSITAHRFGAARRYDVPVLSPAQS